MNKAKTNLNLKVLLDKLLPMLEFLKRYAAMIFFVGVLTILGFLVYRINYFTNIEPDDSAVQAKLQTVQRPQVDKAAIDKIQQLRDQNVQVKALFDQARDNPFSE